MSDKWVDAWQWLAIAMVSNNRAVVHIARKEQTMRTIDADALIESVKRQCNFCRLTADDELIQQFIDVLEKGFIEEVDNAPTIEPKRGEWVKRTHDNLIAQVNFAYCSECGQPIMHEYTRPLWNFCPNCGARMKGADDEDSV